MAAISIAAFGAYGTEITGETAESAAAGFLQRSVMAQRVLPGRTVAGSERWGGLWIVNLAPSGHIVVSGSDKCAPVQQFSSDDFAEPEEDSARLDILTETSERCEAAEADPSLSANSEWAYYTTSSASSSRRAKAGATNHDEWSRYVAPLMNSTWHQGSPYSDFSPLTVVCGCMATAAGQEHRYWRWPYYIPKFRTTVHNVKNEPNQTLRYNGFVPFDYDLIYTGYESGNTPSKTGLDGRGNNAKKARFEAAYLTGWMQSMVGMSFAPGASGGTKKLCNDANDIYFEKGDVQNKWRNGYDTLWTSITNDLEFGSPIQVNTPGHQMVIDGYGIEVTDDTQKDWININYGWGGSETWIDMRTQYDSSSLADFQVGYRPRKTVQIEPIAKKVSGSVDITFHLPFCYTNKVDSFWVYTMVVQDESESFVDYVSVPCGESNTSTVFSTNVSVSAYSDGQKLKFYVEPVMLDGSETLPSDGMETTVGTPAAPPSIESVSAPANGIELLQDGFFAECGIGITNEIKVTCANATGLAAYPSRVTMLPDEKVGIVTNASVFTVKLDASEMLSDWDGDMMLLTLAANNVDGTTVYKNLVLRFSNVRKVVNGTYQLIETGAATEPLEFCGTDCELDANGHTLELTAGMLTGTGSVTLENTDAVSGGGFVIDTLNGFGGTISLKDGVAVTLPSDTSGYSSFSGTISTVSGTVPIVGDVPAAAKINIAQGATNVLDGVSILATVTGAGTVCVTNGLNRLGDCSGFDGVVIVSGSGTTLEMGAGDESSETLLESGATLQLDLDDEQYNFGYAASTISGEGSVVFKYNGETVAHVERDGAYIFEPTANTWTSTGDDDNYSSTGHWSKGRLPEAGEYAIFRTTNALSSIVLDLQSDIALAALKVAGTDGGCELEIVEGTGTLFAGKFTNDAGVNLNTTQIVAETVEPGTYVLLNSGKAVAFTVASDYAPFFRVAGDLASCALPRADCWHGTVEFAGFNTDVKDGESALNPNMYGNSNSVVRFKNVVGRLYYSETDGGATYLPTIELVDPGESPALLWHNGSGTVAEVFTKLTGDGTFRTRSPANGGWEKVLVKDVSDFHGDFDLEAKTVGLGGNAVPSTDTSNSGRLHVCADVTNNTDSVWRAADNLFIAGGATLSVKGVIDTQTIVSYGPNATLNLLDGGEIRVLSGSASSDVDTFAQNFYAGTFKLKDSITQENPINFCSANGTWTTVDVDGLTLALGPDAMTGSGDIYFTSSDTVNRGRVVIQGLDSYSGTIHIGENVDIEFPEDSSKSDCTVLVASGKTFSVKAGTECNLVVESGATLNVILSAEQILYGYDASENVTVYAGGTVLFVNRSGDALTDPGMDTVYEPKAGVTTGLEATAVWMSGDFGHPTNGYSIALNDNIISNRNIFIESGNLKGVTIDLPASTYTKASVIVRFRIPSGGAPSDNTAIAGVISTDGFPISAISPTMGGSALQGAYLNKNNGYALNTGSWNFTDGDAPSADAGHGYMLFAYQSDTYGDTSHGTAVYLGTSLENLYGGNKSDLQWGGNTLRTIAIGGPVDDKEKTHVWAGLEIDGIALFADQWLTAETAQDFAFPHAELNVFDGETLSVTAGNPRAYESIGALSATGTIRIDNIAVLGEGTYEIARWRVGKEPSAYGEIGTLDVEGLYEDYGAELVYGTTSISLRVFKAVYSVTLDGGAFTFASELFDPDLPSDYSRKTLEVNVTDDSTLEMPSGGVSVKAIDFNIADGKTLVLEGGAISADVIGITGNMPIFGTLALGDGTVIKLSPDVPSPVVLATNVTGAISALMLGDSVYGGKWDLDGNVLKIERYKAISINFGSNQASGSAVVGRSAWAGLASVAKWIDTMDYGVNGTYPTVGRSSISLSDSEGTSYPEMTLYINSRGGNYYGRGDTSTETARLLYGFLDDFSSSTVNSGVKVTGVNTFAAKYAAYVYFNADASIGSTDCFPPYYINGVMYRGDGQGKTVPGRERWGTVLSDSLAEGVNALVVHGLTNDTLVVAQPHNMGGRGCIAAIQIVEESADDHAADFAIPDGMSAVTVVPPSGDWSDRTLPAMAFATNVTGSCVSFGSTSPTDYYQLLGNRQSIVALITGTDDDVYEAAGLQSECDTSTKNCGDRDLYLIVTGGSFSNVIGIINQNYGGIANGSQTGGNAMAQIGGDTVVQYAYGAGREGNGGNAPGSVGLTIMDSALLTGSAFGGWSSYHNGNPAVNGSANVKVLNVQSVNSAPNEQCLRPGVIVGGSVYGANSGSASTIRGSSSVVVDLSGLAAEGATNFVKKIIGGSAAFAGGGNGGTYAVAGNSSVTITAPNNVTFTGDITGGGFIENNSKVYTTVGGDSSVTINGGTYSDITITAGARGDGTDRATVAGDATLTINGGVFTGATLAAGSADGEKILVLGSGANISDATVTGFTTFVLPADTMFPYQLASSVTVPDGVDPVLVIGEEAYDSEWSISGGRITLGGLARTAFFVGGEASVAWADLPWNVTIPDENVSSATNTINVTASGTIALGSVTTAKVVFCVPEGVELVLTGTVSASEIHVSGPGTVVCSAANTLQGTVFGDGTVVYNGVKPASVSYGNEDGWTGVVWIKDIASASEERKDWDLQGLGNTNSVLRFSNVNLYFSNSDTMHFDGTVDLQGSGLNVCDGYGGSKITIDRLAGSGTLSTKGGSANGNGMAIRDASAFAGTIELTKYMVTIGDTTETAANGVLLVASGKIASVAGDKTWKAPGGVVLNGTLDLSASTSAKPIDGTLTVSSDSTIKIPEDAGYPYVLATDVTVSGDTLPTLYIGDYTYPLWTIANGAIYPGGLSRSATLRGGDCNWSELWPIHFSDESQLTNTIKATANSTLALGTVNTAKVVFDVAEGVELVLTGTVSASEICATGLGSVVCSAADVFDGTVSGDGTMVYDGITPPEGVGWTDGAWTGAVWLMNIASETALPVNKWCNAGSKVKFTNVKGYLPGKNNAGAWQLDYTDGPALGELVLQDDGDGNVAYTRSNGWSHSATYNSYCMFSKLSGSGTFADATLHTVYVVFNDASEFAGSLYFSKNTTVVIGDSSPEGTSCDGMIVVESGKSATIATDKTWKASDAGLLVKGSVAFAGTGSFEGNVTSESGSTLDFSGSTSGQPVSGTLTIANGTTIKLPSGATSPYTLADTIAISDPRSVTLQIGERVYSSTGLEVSGGAIVSADLDARELESGLDAGGRVMLLPATDESFFDDIILPDSANSLYFVLQRTSAGVYLAAIPAWADTVNVNFTHGSASLSTSDPVGMVGVPGTEWDNVTGVATSGGYQNAKVVSEDGTQSVAIQGLDVSYSGTRGSWQANALESESDLRHGYLDDADSDNARAPSVTITGIPFDKYRVFVYHSTDTANAKFGYDMVNGVDLCYADAVRQSGTAAWGNAGASNSANPMEEGVNTLVSGVQTSGDLVVVAHRGGNAVRSGLAAIQIAKVEEATISAAGTYTLADLFGSVSETSDFYVNVAEDATLDIPDETTIRAIEFNVASGKALALAGAKLATTAGGFTVSGDGTVLVDASQAGLANPRVKVVEGKVYGASAIGVDSAEPGVSCDVVPGEGVYVDAALYSASFALGPNSYITGTYVTNVAQTAFEGMALQQFHDGGYELKGRFAGGWVSNLGIEATGSTRMPRMTERDVSSASATRCRFWTAPPSSA